MPKNDNNEPDKIEKLHRVIDEGAAITGGAIGGALGVITGDPTIASALGAAGAAAGNTLRFVGNEIVDRVLGPRERKRVGAVISIISKEILAHTQRGGKIRTDGFFDRNLSGRCDAEEVAESVILKCQREPEEKKIKYMAHFFSNVSFHPEISAHMAHQLCKYTEQMTYRQFCLLKLAKFDNYRPQLRDRDYRGQEEFSGDLQQVLYEIYDLYNRGFVNFGGEVAFGPTDVKPRTMKAQGLGMYLANLLNVEFIPKEDLSPIIKQLQ